MLTQVRREVKNLFHFPFSHEAGCAVGTFIGIIEIALLVIHTAVTVAHSHDKEYEHGKQNKADQDACHAVWKRKG